MSQWRRPLVFERGILCSVAMFLASSAFGAGSGVNAGDHRSLLEDTAWFLDTSRPVRVCLDVAADFPQPDKLGELVKKAHSSWTSYIEEKIQCGAMPTQDRQASKLNLLAACDGSEDLKIYFGTSSPEVAAAKRGLSDPLAFSKKSAALATQFWSKGFIWISKSETFVVAPEFPPVTIDWTGDSDLYAILLHEFGHIFGNGHYAGTILSESIVERLVNRRYLFNISGHYNDDAWTRRIDDKKELLLCPRRYKGVVNALGYKAFTGKDTSDSEIPISVFPAPGGGATFRLMTSTGNVDIPLAVAWEIPAASLVDIENSDFPVFRRYAGAIAVGTSDFEPLPISRSYGPALLNAVLQAPTGQNLPALVARNIDKRSPLVLKIVVDGEMHSLDFTIDE